MIDLQDIPDTSGVYMLFNGEECLYVGSSLRMRERLSSHPYRNMADSIDYATCTKDDLVCTERIYVEKLRPSLNKAPVSRAFRRDLSKPLRTWKPGEPINGEDFGLWLGSLGLSTRQLATKLGVTTQTVNNMLSGKSRPKQSTLEAFKLQTVYAEKP